MRALKLLLTAFWLLLFSATLAHADIVSLAVGVIGGLLKGATLGAIILNAAIGAALSVVGGLIQKALAKKPEARGVQLQVEMGDDKPVSAVIGRYATAGKRKYIGTWGSAGKTPNAYVTDVIEIGNYPSFAGPLGLTSVWIGEHLCAVLWDQPHEDGRGYPIAQFRTANGTDHLWIKYLDGSQTAADPFLLAKFGDDPDHPYTASMVGRGCQAVILTARFHRELFSGGLPQGLYEPHPVRMYDLRKDSTNGGAGPHRWNNPSTWEPTLNPMVQAYNIIRGMYYDGQWFYGGQNLAAHRLPASSWMPAMNECDKIVPIKAGGTRPQFRSGLEIRGDVEPLDVLEELQLAANARIAEVGGVFKVLVGAPGAAVYSFTDDDIIVTDGQRFEPFPALDSTYNGIEGTYPAPWERWAMKDAPARYNAAMEALDGNRRLLATVQYNAVPYAGQVQQLMRAAIEEARRHRIHRFHLPPDAWPLEPNDVVSWSSTRNGYLNKKFIVDEIEGEASFCQAVTLRELDPTDYDWSSDFEMPTSEGWLGPLVPPEQPMTGWTVEPAYLTDAAGNPRRPSIRVGCAADQDDVMRVWVQVRLKATGDVVFDSDATPYAPPFSWVLAGNFLANTEYEARGKYVPYTARGTAWSAWLAVITPDLKFSWEDLHEEIRTALEELKNWIRDDTIDQLIQQVQDLATGLAAEALARAQALTAEAQARANAIAGEAAARADAIADEAQARGAAIADEAAARMAQVASEQAARIAGAIEASGRYRALFDEVIALRDLAMDSDIADWQAREEIRRSLVASIEGYAASFDERISVAASDIAAVAQRTTTLEASTLALGASVSAVDAARVSGDEALAQQIAYLTAGNLNQFDQLHDWYFDNGPDDWTGNGAPTAAGGYLRPANHASEPYVMSPAGLGVSATMYSQVRGRVRRMGAPVWRGQLWWMTAADPTWDVSRRVSIDEPTFDGDGNALITFTPEWATTVTRIRLDLTEAQTTADYMEIDWVAIGRPSPGASVAALAAERLARIDADSAQAADIVALEARAASAESGLSGLAAGVSALETSVTAIGADVSAIGEALDTLSLEVDGKAEIDTVNAMSAEIATLGAGVLSQGSTITAIRATLLPSAMEVVDQDFANFLAQQAAAAALTEATTSLNSRIDLSNTSIDLLSSAVTQVQVELPSLAKSAALSALEVRVTATEAAITVSTNAITAINAALPTKASVSAVSLLSGRVDAAEGTLSAHTTAIGAINAVLPDKASVDALDALTTTVTAIGDDVTALGEALNTLSLEVDGKAEVDTVSAMSAEIATLGAGILSQGSTITAIRATLLPSAMEVVDQDFANFLAQQAAAAALTEATTSLNSRIDLSNTSIDLLSSAVTQVQVELPSLAKASAVNALEVRVTATEGAIAVSANAITSIEAALPGKASVDALSALSATVSSQGDAITALGSAVTSINAILPDKATVGAVDALTLRVTATEGAITSQADAITAINTALPGKASVSALDSLSGRVDAAEGSISTHTTALTSINAALPGKADVSALNTLATTVSAQGDNISALTSSVNAINATLPGKASVSALNALQTQVSNQGDEISAQAIWLGEVQANVNGSLADARFKMEVVSGPAGFARIGMMARVSPGSGAFRTGGIFLDVPTNISLPVQALVEASRFAVIDGATKKVPFAISGGVCYLTDVNIQNAIIGDLQVGTHNLQLGAVTRHDGAALGQAGIVLGQTIDAMGLTIAHGTESPTMYVFFSCSLLVNGNLPTDGFTEVTVLIRNNHEGNLATFPVTFRKGTLVSHCFQFTPPARNSTQFLVRLTLNSGPGSSNPGLLVNNRLIQVLTARR